MPYYRLYHFQGKHFARFDDFEAEDDVRALGEAKRLNGDGHSELWSGKCRIAELKRQ
jgi:hypothetical protein